MSARRSSIVSAGAVLALALTTPGTAAAAGGSAEGRDGRPGKAGAHDEPRKTGPAAAERRSDARSTGEPSRRQDSGRATSSEAKSSSKPSGTKASGSEARKGRTSGTARSDAGNVRPGKRGGDAATRPGGSGDPRGNNGTIKIDTVPGDAERSNRPHPGCTFVLKFFNFDAGQHADITFTGQAPTAAGTLLTLPGQLISSTPADGELEAAHSLTLTAADLGLLGTPQAAKGWHVKVAVDALEAPGGAKQKVFWLDCAQESAPATGTEPTAGEQDADVAASGAGAATAVGGAAAGGVDTGVGVLGSGASRATVLDRVAPAAAAARADRSAVARQSAGQTQEAPAYRASVLPFAPSALPFTGPMALGLALATGLAAVGGGALALRAGRRRAVPAALTGQDG